MLIFGGTTEGRRLARALSAMGHQVWVSVATPLGAEELAGLEDVSVLVGRRSGGEMDALLSRGFHRCVDATHPYAVQATREIGAACARAGVPLRRLLRPEGGEEGLRVDSPEEAARLLAGREGNILLATGAKELPAFAALEPARLFPRVLPSEESVAACRRAGIPSRNIIALYGPFTQRLNEALMEQFIRGLRRRFEGGQNVRVTFEQTAGKAPVECGSGFIAAAETACRTLGARYRKMPSGATHDGNMMALRVPIGMLFVPSRGGISHSREEWTDWSQCRLGCEALYRTILNLEG